MIVVRVFEELLSSPSTATWKLSIVSSVSNYELNFMLLKDTTHLPWGYCR